MLIVVVLTLSNAELVTHYCVFVSVKGKQKMEQRLVEVIEEKDDEDMLVE